MDLSNYVCSEKIDMSKPYWVLKLNREDNLVKNYF